MILPASEPLDGNLAAVMDLHFQLMTPQEPHPDEGFGVGFIDKDLAYFAVPHDLGLVHIKNALAAVGQRETVHASPAETQGVDDGGW
jgi:hypothetical protein